MGNKRNSADFWKENDQEFYRTKEAIVNNSKQAPKKAQILEEIKQDLWVSKERSQQQKKMSSLDRSKRSLIVTGHQKNGSLPDLKNIQPTTQNKARTFKKVSKKIFNEDLVEIGD